MFDEKIVLISGGTGTFGQAFVTELLKTEVKRIRIYSRGEYLQAEMRRKFPDERLRFMIGDVRDKERLDRAMSHTDIVVHAAALKRIENCEYNPMEAHKTNVDGTENVVNCAIDRHVEKVLAISSDKAVHPINVYGVTKQHMEKIIIGGNISQEAMFSCIRSGNFTYSKGNVLQLWDKEMRETGELTVTNKVMSRYWITLEDIAKFAVKCLNIMEGNEIFIPKMTQVELAQIIEELYPDAKLNIIGNRPGEKLTELLFNEGEEPEDCGDYWVIKIKQAGGR